jgi:hypothetical protein
VPLLRGLKPEFGCFCPSPNPKLSLALAFTVFGLVACTSGVALLVADYDPDPQSAFALAPPQSPSRETAPPAATAMPATVLAQKVTKADGIKSCRRNASDDVDGNCDSSGARKPGVVHAVTDPPAAAEIPISHGNGPAVGAPESAVLVASTAPLKEGAPESTDAAPPSLAAEAPAPEGSATKPQKAARQQSSRRYSYEDSSLWPFDQHYRRGGHARQRPLTLFDALHRLF